MQAKQNEERTRKEGRRRERGRRRRRWWQYAVSYGTTQILVNRLRSAMSPVPLCHATSTGVSPSLAINMNCLITLQHATFLQLLGPSEPHSLLNSRSLASGFSGRPEDRRRWHCHHHLGGVRRRWNNLTVAAERFSGNGPQHSTRPKNTRKVVEHVVLYKMKDDLTDEQEKDMLDHLFSLQYRFRGILAVSLGRVIGRMPDGVTHALFQRFHTRESLEQYMDHPAHIKVFDEFISPHYKGVIIADFEAEVENDIEALFRRGDDFQQGIEHVVFIKVREGTSQAGAESMVEAFNALPQQVDSSILIQLTAGINVSELNKGYTHGVLARLPSEEALDTFSKHPAYVQVFTEKVLPISAGLLSADFLVDPVTRSSPL